MKRITTQTRALAAAVLTITISQAAEAAEGSTIAYRLMQTKTLHFADSTTANQHYKAVQQLGCEVKRDSHGGHTDVMYRLTQWKQMTVANDQLAHQWQSWLQRAGFETLHGHAESDGHSHDHEHFAGDGHDHAHGEEAVDYRLPQWTSQRFEREIDRAQFVAIAKALGCEVRPDGNSVSIRCASWKHAEFPTHAVAGQWEQWLKQLGFETRHSH